MLNVEPAGESVRPKEWISKVADALAERYGANHSWVQTLRAALAALAPERSERPTWLEEIRLALRNLDDGFISRELAEVRIRALVAQGNRTAPAPSPVAGTLEAPTLGVTLTFGADVMQDAVRRRLIDRLDMRPTEADAVVAEMVAFGKEWEAAGFRPFATPAAPAASEGERVCPDCKTPTSVDAAGNISCEWCCARIAPAAPGPLEDVTRYWAQEAFFAGRGSRDGATLAAFQQWLLRVSDE